MCQRGMSLVKGVPGFVASMLPSEEREEPGDGFGGSSARGMLICIDCSEDTAVVLKTAQEMTAAGLA